MFPRVVMSLFEVTTCPAVRLKFGSLRMFLGTDERLAKSCASRTGKKKRVKGGACCHYRTRLLDL